MRDEQQGEILRGTLRRIRWSGNNWLIGELSGGATVVGPVIAPQAGLDYTLTGVWVNDPKWGRQFRITSARAELPTSLGGIARYLDENCKWIGDVTARAITTAYGANALGVLKNDPARVAAEISGITPARAAEIAAVLRENEDTEAMFLALDEVFGGTRATRPAIQRVAKAWGKDAPAIVRADPYRLCEEIRGFGFVTADEVAQRVKFAPNHPSRLRAGILHVIEQGASTSGHMYLPRPLLASRAAELLTQPADAIGARIEELAHDGELVSLGEDSDEAVYTAAHHGHEASIAATLAALMQARPVRGLRNVVGDFVGLAEDQAGALTTALHAQVFALTGAPGTGKTFMLKALLGVCHGHKVALAAPTGKAAKRMAEQTRQPATTIHRLLEPKPDEKGKFTFTRGPGNPLTEDVIVLDEVSMLDSWLADSVFSAVRPGARLILVGDSHQLPSVGPGNVLREIIASGVVPSVELQTVKRQNPGLLLRNIHRVKDGLPVEVANGAPDADFFFLSESDPDAIRSTIVDLVTRRLPAKYGVDKLRDIQVITPLREKTGLGCKSLNDALQRAITGEIPESSRDKFLVGDKVIQTVNDYGRGVVNGDIGYVAEVRTSTKEIVVEFESPSRTVVFPLRDNELMLAYAITCHKFQGSEAPIIVMPAHRCFGELIYQKNWVYTALSRARDVCVVVGDRVAFGEAVARDRQSRRFSRLAALLRAETVPTKPVRIEEQNPSAPAAFLDAALDSSTPAAAGADIIIETSVAGGGAIEQLGEATVPAEPDAAGGELSLKEETALVVAAVRFCEGMVKLVEHPTAQVRKARYSNPAWACSVEGCEARHAHRHGGRLSRPPVPFQGPPKGPWTLPENWEIGPDRKPRLRGSRTEDERIAREEQR